MRSREKYPGKFITFEGGEGSGKSTVLESLKLACRDNEIDAVFVSDPSKELESTIVFRDLLLSDKYDLSPQTELMLYMCARNELIDKIIVPALKEGKTVFSDRFDLSTWAYQGAGRGVEPYYITTLSNLIKSPIPDYTIIFDIDPEVGLKRSKARLNEGLINEGKFEALDLEFHKRVRRYMWGYANKKKKRCKVVKVEEKTRTAVFREAFNTLLDEGLV